MLGNTETDHVAEITPRNRERNLWRQGQAGGQAGGQVSEQASEQASEHAGEQEDKTIEILEFCKIARTRSEIQDFLGVISRGHFIPDILDPLVKGDLLKMTIPDKPTSPKQKYYSERH